MAIEPTRSYNDEDQNSRRLRTKNMTNNDEWIPIGPTRRVPSAGFEFNTLVRRIDLDVCLELLAADPSMSGQEIKLAAHDRGHDVAAGSFVPDR